LRWPVLIFVVIFGLAVLYRFGPSREHPRWEWLSVGSVLAAGAWLGSHDSNFELGIFRQIFAVAGDRRQAYSRQNVNICSIHVNSPGKGIGKDRSLTLIIGQPCRILQVIERCES
jgi:hypothetical protein